MEASKLHAFLDRILVDSVGASADLPNTKETGYVYWEDNYEIPKHEDFHVLDYGSAEGSPFRLDGDSNHSVFMCTMALLIRLRKYWRDGYLEGEEPELNDALDSMSSDVQSAIEHLIQFRNALLLLKTGEDALRLKLKKTEVERSAAVLARHTAQQKENAATFATTEAKYTLDLYKILTEGPVEQLARLASPAIGVIPNASPLVDEVLELLADTGKTNKTEETTS
jgi:hypothetical protein